MADLNFGDTPTTLMDFVEGADAHFHFIRSLDGGDSNYRIGQAYMNYFAFHFPEAARPVLATNCDPFHNDANVGRMLSYIVDNGYVSA